MRGARSLLALIVVALGLGAYIYFVESKRDLTDPETRRDKVFAIEPGTIEEVQIRAVSGEVTTLKKNGEEWQISSPVTAAADSSAASSLVSALETLEIQKPLEENPASLAPFGLEPARFSVAFKTAGDAAEHRLNVGNKTPTGSDLYARVDGEPRLFLISGYLEDTLSRSTFDLRDKSVLSFATEGVDAIRLQPAGSPAVSLARSGSDWRLTTPVDARADATAVDALINRASQARMTSIVKDGETPPSPAELRTFGLDTPRVVATFGAGSTQAALAVGGKTADGAVYARDLSRPLVFTVEASLLEDLAKSAGDLRVKDIFQFRPYTALGIDITHGTTTASFEKSAPGGDPPAPDVWKQTKPEPRDVNQTAMTDLLNTLSSLRAENFVSRAAASGEDIVVAARSGDSAAPTSEQVTLRKSGGVVHAIRPGEPGAAVVPTAEFDKAVGQLKELTGGQ
jgi:hypothetical protein